MARATMADLIERLRAKVDDVDAALYSDDLLQEHLDDRRQRANQMPLTPEPTRQAGGSTVYLVHVAPLGDWEDGVTLVDSGYESVTPDSGDLQAGRWTFTTEPDWPVYLTGWTYDLYGAAADVLEQRATELAEKYSFSADGGQFQRHQMRQGLLETAATYRRRQRVVTVEQFRGDVNVN